MIFKNAFIYLLCLSSMTVKAQAVKPIEAALGKIAVKFMLDENGTPRYTVYFDKRPAILPSRMGFNVQGAPALSTGFEIVTSATESFDESWQPVWGEVNNIRNHYTQLTVRLKERNAPGRLLNIIFRVFEDGVGFRYEFPGQPGLKYFIVTDELTEFQLAGNHKTFWIPADYDSNEYLYTTSQFSDIDAFKVRDATPEIAVKSVPEKYAVQTPLMMKTSDGLYINIHEAALINFPAMQLRADKSSFKLTAMLVPDAVGNKAYVRAPAVTPWRTVIVSDKAVDILASKTVLNLNEPSKIENTSWIKPMKFIGVWWMMHLGKATWNYADNQDSLLADGALKPNGTHGANTANTKKYIDFAASNGIDGVLVEGWNAGWEEWFGNWKENVFDFVTPYPDFDVAAIAAYARSKDVEMIMHHETSGSATNYERYMDTAYRFMKQFGYDAVKTGYVGSIIPRGEHHDGQWMINHYELAAKKAMQYGIMLDSHEPVRSTGLHRTYPNWMSAEAARGNEFCNSPKGNTPEHETILPFTRLMGGPMDYTPGIFKIKLNNDPVVPKRVNTTLAKQLALFVTMYSPLQMAGDLVENYESHMDAFQFIKDVAVDWDDTKIIEAEPGDYITTARKAKGSANWFIGAITDENGRTATIPLNFLDKDKKYTATIYRDADNADWIKNSEAYTIESFIVDDMAKLKIKLAAGGGAAISIMPATDEQVKKLKAYK